MNFWLIVVLLGGGYLLQCVFGLMQMKDFSKTFRPLRQMGRVAIGRTNGGLRAGAIVMFDFNGFEGKNVGELTQTDVEKLPKPLRKAILDAAMNYNIIMSGGEIPPRLSLFQKIEQKLSPKKPAVMSKTE